MVTEAVGPEVRVPPPVYPPPYVHRPPFAGVLKAEEHTEDFVVPLGIDEQSYAFQPSDFVLVFKEKAEPDRMASALERALVKFPIAAGRFMEQDVTSLQSRTPLTIQAMATRKRICILCNNAGAGWSALEYSESTPSPNGPMANVYVDLVSDTQPGANGQLGAPLLRLKLSSFPDGQILGVSFAQGLSDCMGISMLLKYWSCLYRGDDPGPSPVFDRLELEDAFRCLEPGRVKPDFALLKKSRSQTPPLAPEKSVLSFTWTAEEVKSKILEIQTERTSRHVSLDRAGKNLEALDVACATIFSCFECEVPVHMWVDYRTEFEMPCFELLFGNARGQIAFDMPTKYEDAAELVRKRIFASHRTDFWGWQRMQQTKTEPTGVTISALVDDLLLQSICFHAGDVARVGLPMCHWEEQMKTPGYVAVMPDPGGGCHVEALVPRLVASRISGKMQCKLFAIR